MISIVISAFVGLMLAMEPFVVGHGALFELPLGVVVMLASLARIGFHPARWLGFAVGLWFIVAPVLAARRLSWPSFVFEVVAGLILVAMAMPQDLHLPRRTARDRHAMSGF